MDRAGAFEAERARLVNLASRVLGDRHEAEDIVQTAWLRFDDSTDVLDPPAWLTTVTTRLCLDRLKARIPHPAEAMDIADAQLDPSASVERAEGIGQALHVLTEALTPNERVAFILAETFRFDAATIGDILGRTAGSARQLTSRARRKVSGRTRGGAVSDWQVVDAFMAAARGGDLERLLELLAPDAAVSADATAVLAGTPSRIVGKDAVADFFNGSARAALPVFVGERAGAAWFDRGRARVVFDFTILDGAVDGIVFRADPTVLGSVVRRRDGEPRTTTRGAASRS